MSQDLIGVKQLTIQEQHEILSVFIFPQAREVYETDGNRWVCDCPAHNDTRQNLIITINPLSFTCRSGCSLFSICEGFHVDAQTLFPMEWPLIWMQQSEAIERDPVRLVEWYKEAIKTGLKLTDEEKQEYRQLVLNQARRAA